MRTPTHNYWQGPACQPTKDYALCASVIARRQRPKAFLPGRVPYRQLYPLSLQRDIFDPKINTCTHRQCQRANTSDAHHRDMRSWLPLHSFLPILAYRWVHAALELLCCEAHQERALAYGRVANKQDLRTPVPNDISHPVQHKRLAPWASSHIERARLCSQGSASHLEDVVKRLWGVRDARFHIAAHSVLDVCGSLGGV